MADLDRLIRETNPEPGQPRVPTPQYQKIDGVGYEKVKGQHGGAYSVLLGPDGQPISSSNRLPVDVTGSVGISGTVASNVQLIKDAQGRLYGYDGTTWRAVKVTTSGQLELAQNVVIDNVTVNVGAEVKVNNLETEPVPVTLSGNIVHMVKSIVGVTLTSGSTIRIAPNEVAPYRRIWVVIRPNGMATYEIRAIWKRPWSPTGDLYGATLLKADNNASNALSEIVDVKSTHVDIDITNNTTTDYVIDLALVGVR